MTDPTPASDAQVAELREQAEAAIGVTDFHGRPIPVSPPSDVLALLARLDAQTRTIEHYKRWLDEAEADRDRWEARAEEACDEGVPIPDGWVKRDLTITRGTSSWPLTAIHPEDCPFATESDDDFADPSGPVEGGE